MGALQDKPISFTTPWYQGEPDLGAFSQVWMQPYRYAPTPSTVNVRM
jgi:hypothetical protein